MRTRGEPGASDALDVDDTLLQAFVRERSIATWLRQIPSSMAGQLFAGLLLGAIWWVNTRSIWPLAWAGTLVAALLLRLVYTERIVRMPGRVPTETRISALMVSQGALITLPLLGFSRFPAVEQAAVSIILVALATASVATTAGFRLVFLYYAVPILMPLALAWALAASEAASPHAGLGMAALVLVYQTYLIGLSRQIGRVVQEAARFRYSQERMNQALKQALDTAESSSRAKTQFLAAASHDLRQPMHSMNVLVAALSLKTLDKSVREIVNMLDAVNQSMTRQLDSLLDISKLDAGIVVPRLKTCQLDAMLRNLVLSASAVAGERGLSCHLSIGQPLAVRSDESLLGRVLSNLTDNAIKFTPRGGAITISLQREGDTALIEIRDSGIGIPPELQSRVFEEFYQIGNPQRDRTRGLGLGLSIVKRLCDLLGASLTLQSRVGEGTRFEIRLPLALTPETEPAQPPVAVPAATARIVLVIDDELAVRQSMRVLLEELGCTVLDAAGTNEATRVAAEHPIDLILSDMRLADGDSGIEAIRQVRARRPGARAVLITGDTAPERLREAQASGLILLHKPVSLESLTGVLDASTD
ncbi:MAG: hybrid sensor histidine kinase/response regulator [Betaproteobacteria bacterium]|nr:hybrid sensor histidine kinase/response regulator [Betaproteobacteria bacterium]